MEAGEVGVGISPIAVEARFNLLTFWDVVSLHWILQVGRLFPHMRGWDQLQKSCLQQPQTNLWRPGWGWGDVHVLFVQACRGKNEEFKLCNINRCIKGIIDILKNNPFLGGDVRAEQCQSEFYMASTR